jgi:hypothetical protein
MTLGGGGGGCTRPTKLVGEDRVAGLAWARAWRVRNKPHFDALFGPDDATAFCPECGKRR